MKKASLFFFCICIFTVNLFAHKVYIDNFDVVIDLPEGFVVTESNGTDRFLLKNQLLPCVLQISCDAPRKFSATKAAAQNIFSQLSAKHKDLPTFFWCNNDAQLSTFTCVKDDNYNGWVLVLKMQTGWLTLTAFCKETDAVRCEPMIISALDSVYTTDASYYVPGPITSCLYQRAHTKTVKNTINNVPVTFYIDEIDAEANKSVVDREFELLTCYLDSQYAVDAWKRYYENIFRDAWKRLESFSFEIKNILTSQHITEPLEIVQFVLDHVQTFEYVRDREGADFVDLVTASVENKGDCDTRGLLMDAVLAQLGFKTALLVSPVFSHAISGVDVIGKGARLTDEDTSYLVAETTAHVKAGQIAADIADEKQWFITPLYTLPKK